MGRRGFRDDAIYFDHSGDCRDTRHHKGCPGRWRGAVSLGYGPDGKRVRRKVSGRTKQDVKDKLAELHGDIQAGIQRPTGRGLSDVVALLGLDQPLQPGDLEWVVFRGEVGVVVEDAGLARPRPRPGRPLAAPVTERSGTANETSASTLRYARTSARRRSRC